MAGRRRSGGRGPHALGQHFLVDATVVERLLARLDLEPGELVVDVGAGHGALTLPLARAGARVLAVERDPRLVRVLQEQIERQGLAGRVQLRRADLRDVALPRRTYRVVANPPFGLTTALFERLFDDPSRGPRRADLLLQWGVARKRAQQPAASLRSAGWAPWWCFELGEKVSRHAFDPAPGVDTGWLRVVRRDPPILPPSLATDFVKLLRPAWDGAGAGAGGRHPRR